MKLIPRIFVFLILFSTLYADELKPIPDLKKPTDSDAQRVSEITKIGQDWWLRHRGLLAEESFRIVGYFTVARSTKDFADVKDTVWEIRVIYLHTHVPTGVLWINERTKKVIALGIEEKQKAEPPAPPNRSPAAGSR